jgi:hypothetical protein
MRIPHKLTPLEPQLSKAGLVMRIFCSVKGTWPKFSVTETQARPTSIGWTEILFQTDPLPSHCAVLNCFAARFLRLAALADAPRQRRRTSVYSCGKSLPGGIGSPVGTSVRGPGIGSLYGCGSLTGGSFRSGGFGSLGSFGMQLKRTKQHPVPRFALKVKDRRVR